MTISDLPSYLQNYARAERSRAQLAAANFAAICAGGDANGLYNASLWLDECVDAWRRAMTKVAKLKRVSQDIQDAFVPIWVEHKMLPLDVGNRPILAKALSVLMPGVNVGRPLTVYRGTSSHERRRRIYGFSWTVDVTVARGFAQHWGQAGSRGVLLETQAPPDALLLMREPENYYDEGEVVVDPYRLGRIKLIEITDSTATGQTEKAKTSLKVWDLPPQQ
jgi:hypothetical protein